VGTLLHISDITPKVLELAGVTEADSTPANLAALAVLWETYAKANIIAIQTEVRCRP